MKRILIIGSGGSGKSTLARRLGPILGIDVVHLDALYWRPGWVEPPKEQWAGVVAGVAARDSWIMDGNFGGTLSARLAAADAVVFLDLPRLLCAARVVTRWLRYRRHTRPDMGAGCPEKLDAAFLKWVWDYPVRSRPSVLEKIGHSSPDRRVYVLRSRADVERFVQSARRGRLADFPQRRAPSRRGVVRPAV